MNLNKKTLKSFDFRDKKVLVRVDFNVPLEDNKVADDTRIREALPTIKYLLENGAKKVILCSHLGRPKGKVVESLRMDPVAQKLKELLGQNILKLDDCVGEEIKAQIESTQIRLILLENLRFHPEEEKGDENFAKELAELADIYVNDAFGTAHRAHASTCIVAKFLPSCIGFLMEKEIKYLSKIILNPDKPFVAILGGAKVSDKIRVIENLLDKVDKILIGGAMSYTFLKTKGINIGNSKIEADKLDLATRILELAQSKGVKIILPQDHIVAQSLDKPETKRVTDNEIPEGFMGLDIGPKTIELFKEELKTARTILWNGPVGVFEKDDFSQGTKELALYLADLTSKGVTTVIGGGDSASAVAKFKVKDKLTHVSTGGGASLEFLEGKDLPGISAIEDE